MSNFKTVIQLTSVTTGVAQEAYHGRIQCFTATTAADASYEFTFTNPNLRHGAQLFLSLLYAGTQGAPIVRVKSYAVGSCVLVVTNAGTQALNGAVSVDYSVFQN